MEKNILILIVVVVVVVLLAAALLFYEMRKPKKRTYATSVGDCAGTAMLVNGASASKTPVTSLEDCQSYCDGIKGCVGVSYSKSKQMCLPKDKSISDLTTCKDTGADNYIYYQANATTTK